MEKCYPTTVKLKSAVSRNVSVRWLKLGDFPRSFRIRRDCGAPREIAAPYCSPPRQWIMNAKTPKAGTFIQASSYTKRSPLHPKHRHWHADL
jgi:hypothetical protein